MVDISSIKSGQDPPPYISTEMTYLYGLKWKERIAEMEAAVEPETPQPVFAGLGLDEAAAAIGLAGRASTRSVRTERVRPSS